METLIIQISDLHFEHKQWERELLFLEDELQSFNNRLEELVERWTHHSVLAQLEHYQNQFIRQHEIIDSLLHDINVHETDMFEHDKKGELAMNFNLAKKHFLLRERMETQRMIYHDLKREFFKFLSKHM
ncbi:hypothetical protein [Mangrovimonas sp. YM274]|uniref:hypothetical protein n=1 Tax=Mangrovimonas sp. YM274 TaxID=3070660 RepID=UPI0027DC089F|nr:hypothetical protein [Mangrovimonas sp. YM274]WMI69531.1 hypothetical protein RBH95_03985 [Mangrovimonas sp. YM274]